MTHSTFSDLIHHILEGTPLPCSCDDCREKLHALREERNRPAEVTESLKPQFWREQEDLLTHRRRSLLWVPALAAACLVLFFAAVFFVGGTQEEASPTVASLSDAGQELLLMEVETLLDEPPLGDLEFLVDDETEPESQTMILDEGGTYEA